ncbi:MAG TPA: glutamyl-tRNA reductase [Solirubrobacterales bacterium]|nr:glutamyl-tRNA reductase [Solirubrobacterales bacterium]
MTELLAIGISHKTAPVALRERLAFSEGQATGVLHDLHSHPEIHEAVAISTCNRTELYFVVSDAVEAETLALSELTRHAGIRPTELVELLYTQRSEEVVKHLMRVTSGLDSMVVGETEVLGQVKRAYELALVEGVTGPISNRLFRDAIAAAKRVHSETGVGSLKVSVSSAAVELARETFGELAGQRTLVIGAGGNGELTAKALSDAGADTVFVANRRYDRAIGVAQRHGGKAVRFESLPQELIETDIVLSSTGSPHQIIDVDEMKIVMEERAGRPLLMIDIAVPRDIDPEVNSIEGVTLFDMDDLQHAIDRNLNVRRSEAVRAESIIKQENQRFARWMTSLDVVPTVAAMRQRGEAIAQQVVTENLGRFESLSEADRERIDAMARAIVSRMLHEPTLRLKRASGEDDAYAYIQALRELFALDAGSDAPAADAESSAEVRSLDEHRGRDRARRH